MKYTPFAAALAACLCTSLFSSDAQAWEWFRSESSDVARGNQLLLEKKYDDAVKAYDAALRTSPDDPGVQLDKGTALLGAKKYGPARDALRSASRGDVDPEVRSRALYNLGLSFLDEADALGKNENLDDAQARLRESVDAFKASLRAKPGNADAAWNLDLARRRLVDVEKKQEEKKNEDEQKKDDQQKKDDEQKKNEQNGDGGADADGDAGSPDDANADGGEEDAGPDESEPDGGAAEEAGAKGGQDDAQKDAAAQQQGGQDGGSGAQPEAEAPPRDAMERALDALRDSEENLQKQRANQRARQRPQRVLKDW